MLGNCVQLNGALGQKLFDAGRSYPDRGRGKVSWGGSDLPWVGDRAVATLSRVFGIPLGSPSCLHWLWRDVV